MGSMGSSVDRPGVPRHVEAVFTGSWKKRVGCGRGRNKLVFDYFTVATLFCSVVCLFLLLWRPRGHPSVEKGYPLLQRTAWTRT